MCGRFTLSYSLKELQNAFPDVEFNFNIEYASQYNIAPTQEIPVIREDVNGDLRADLFTWGLIPSWAKDKSIGPRLINARSDTVAEKPAFRGAFKLRRCLIPADGFFEWVVIEGTKTKLPIYFFKKSRDVFCFAGLWENWRSPKGEEVNSATIITTEPNELVNRFHSRMPVILPREAYRKWLTPGTKNLSELHTLLKPYPAAEMDCYPVSPLANSAKNDGPEVIAPLKQ